MRCGDFKLAPPLSEAAASIVRRIKVLSSSATTSFPKLYGYVECFSDVSTERDSDWEATFNPGLIYNLTDNVGFKSE